MKKASQILGLIGGVLALVCAAGSIAGGTLIAAVSPGLFNFIPGMMGGPGPHLAGFFGLFGQFGGVALIIAGAFMIAVGVLALVGANEVPRNNVRAGVLMLIAGGIAMITGFGGPIMVLCVLGGVFALVKDKAPGNPPPPQG